MNSDRFCTECERPIPVDAPDDACPVCLLKVGLDFCTDDAGPIEDRDRQLLFGVFAVQLGIVTRGAFIDAAAVWAADPAIALADRLVGLGALPEDKRQLVDRLTAETVDYYGGDTKAALASVDGERYSSQLLSECADADTGLPLSTLLGLPVFATATEAVAIRAVDEGRGRYTTKREHSRGGMGRILVVHDEFLDRDVALKELLPREVSPVADGGRRSVPVQASGALLARFLREAQVTGQLEHPSIVPVYELGRRGDGTVYYTMKLVRGRTFLEALHEARSFTDRLALLPNFVDLCQAIAYAHSRGVIHRDLKPGNVMLGTFGETVVIDWGIAKVAGQRDEYDERLRETIRHLSEDRITDKGGGDRTGVGEIIGTPAYMAPEQVGGRVNEIDARTDVYALGVMLYEILAGCHPFAGGTGAEVMAKVRSGDAPPIALREREAPPQLVSICEKAMRLRPDDRFQSAQALATEIERFQTGALVQTYDYSLRETLKHYYGKYRAIVNVAALALVLLVGGGSYSYFSVRAARDDAIEARDDAQREAYRAQIRLAQSYLQENNYSAARTTLWATPPALRHWEWGRLLDLAYQEHYTLPGFDTFTMRADESLAVATFRDQFAYVFNPADGSASPGFAFPSGEEGAWGPTFSPDGALLAGRLPTGVVAVWNVQTGDTLVTSDDPATAFAFDPSGARLAVGGRDGVIHVRMIGTGGVAAAFTNTNESVTRLRFSDDGARLVAGQGDSLTVWDVATATPAIVVEGVQTAEASDDAQLVAAAREGVVELTRVADGDVLHSIVAHSAGVRRIHFDARGERLLTVGAKDGSASVWNVETGTQLHSFTHTSPVMDAGFSPDGTMIVTTTLDGIIHVWNAQSYSLLNKLSGHANFVAQFEFSRDCETIYAAGFDRTVRAWPARVPAGQQRVATHPDGIASGIRYSESTDTAAVYGGHGVLGLFEVASRRPLGEYASADVRVALPADFDRAGTRIAAALDRFTPMVFDPASGQIVCTLRGHGGSVNALAFSPTAPEVATGAHDGTVRIWDADSGDERLTFWGHSDFIFAVSYSPDGRWIASGDDSGKVVVWEAGDGREVRRLDVSSMRIIAIVWSDDGNTLFVASHDNAVRAFDLAGTGSPLVLDEHKRPAHAIALIDGGARILTGSPDGLRVWDSVDGTEVLGFGGAYHEASDIIRIGTSNALLLRTSTGKSVQLLDTCPTGSGLAPSNEEAFRANRRAHDTVAKPYQIDAAAEMTVITTPEMLSAKLGQLLRLLESPFGPRVVVAEEGLVIGEGAIRDAVVRIGLHEGDVVRSVGGVSIVDGASARDALRHAIAEVRRAAAVTMQIRRRAYAKTVRFAYVPRTDRAVTVALSHADAVGLLEGLSIGLRTFGSQVEEFSEYMARALGEYDEASGEALGIWLGGTDEGDASNVLGLSRLSLEDRIVAIDGQIIRRFAQFRSITSELLEGVKRGDVTKYTVEVERGEFETLRITYAIAAQ